MLSKMYLHNLTGGGAPPTTLCLRFALSEHPPEEGDTNLYDLSLTVLQVCAHARVPTVRRSPARRAPIAHTHTSAAAARR